MRRTLFAAVICALAAGCSAAPGGSVPDRRPIIVFAAASLTEAFTEISGAFEQANPGVEVMLNLASSGLLTRQIQAGAGADVFASAESFEMDALVEAGLVAEDGPRVFLTNRLVVVLPESNPGGLEGLEDLATPGLKVVLAAEDAPIGRYSQQVLAAMDAAYGPAFHSQVTSNVVSYEDNVKQVLAKIQLGEADAGIVYWSDAVASPDLRPVTIPAEFNVRAAYPIAAMRDAPHRELALRFVDFVTSPRGEEIISQWGFEPGP